MRVLPIVSSLKNKFCAYNILNVNRRKNMKKLFVLAILLIVSLALGCKQPNIPAPVAENPATSTPEQNPEQPPVNEGEDPGNGGQNPGQGPGQSTPSSWMSVKILKIKCKNLYITDDSNPFYSGGGTKLYWSDLKKAKGLKFKNPKQLVKKLEQAELGVEESQVSENITFQEVIELSPESTIKYVKSKQELYNKILKYHKGSNISINFLYEELQNFLDPELGPGRYGIFYYMPDGDIDFPYTLYIVVKWRERNIQNFSL